MTTDEPTMHVMATRDLNTSDKPLLKTVAKRVGSCLRHYRSKGVIRSATDTNNRKLWSAG